MQSKERQINREIRGRKAEQMEAGIVHIK